MLQIDLEALYCNRGFAGQTLLPGYVLTSTLLSHGVSGVARSLPIPSHSHLQALRTWGSHSHLSNLQCCLLRDRCDDNAVFKVGLYWIPPSAQKGTRRIEQRSGPTLSTTGIGWLQVTANKCLRDGIGQTPWMRWGLVPEVETPLVSLMVQSGILKDHFCVYVFLLLWTTGCIFSLRGHSLPPLFQCQSGALMGSFCSLLVPSAVSPHLFPAIPFASCLLAPLPFLPLPIF